jgi:hypothetical protein
VTGSERDSDSAGDPLLRAWLLGVAAVGPLFIGVGAGALALDPEGDTAPVFVAILGLPFLVCGAIVTVFAGLLLARSSLYRWAAARRPLIPAIVVAALLLVVPPFLDASSGTDNVSLPLLVLAGTELSIALTWLAAVRVGFAIAATVAISGASLIAAGAAG